MAVEVRRVYFSPEDVDVKPGAQVGRVAWERPCAWDARNALRVSLKDPVAGWQIARQEYRDRKVWEWYRATYPAYWDEKQAFKRHIAEGGSVASWAGQRANAG